MPNAIAETAKLTGTIRTTDTDTRRQIKAGIKRIVSAAGTLHNADVSVDFVEGYPSVINTVVSGLMVPLPPSPTLHPSTLHFRA